MNVDPETKASAQIRAWVCSVMQERLDAQGDVKLPEVAAEAVNHFLEDADFLAGPITDLIRTVAYTEAARFGHRTRGLVVLGDQVVSREQVAERAKRSKFATWLEHVGDRHLRLLDMTRDDLIAAAEERRQRARTEIEISTLWERLAARLEGGQRVRDCFTLEDIEAEQMRVSRAEEIKEDFRRSIKVAPTPKAS